MREMGLYVHIPFCRKKCLYCDFNSQGHQEAAELEQVSKTYVNALRAELALYQKALSPQYNTVFIGGGTPTYIHFELIGSIMETIKPCLAADAEVSMECNPGTVTKESMGYYRRQGINRLSIGLQAWQEGLLRRIGRIHDRQAFLDTYAWAREAGFHNINIDLMFSLPGQTMEDWIETLHQVAALKPEHLSCYSLKLEEGTPLYYMYENNQITLPDEDTDREMYHQAIALLGKAGYRQYEISNFSAPGQQCRHNLVYWKNGEYLGVGTGSHSKLDGRRFWNIRDIDAYVQCIENGEKPVEGEEAIGWEADLFETIFLSLRLNEGLDILELEKKYNISFENRYGAKVEKLIQNGLVARQNQRLFLTEKGMDLSNMVFVEFM